MPIKSHKAGVVFVQDTESIGNALDKMATLNIGSIIVVHQDRAIGIVTERDVLKHWRRLSRPQFVAQSITDIMSHTLLTLPIAKLGDAPLLMIEKKIRHVPLTGDTGIVLGVISMRDVLAAQVKTRSDAPPETTSRPSNTHNMMVLAPSTGLESAIKHFLPSAWKLEIVDDMRTLAEDEKFAEAVAGCKAFFIDLDGLRDQPWKDIMRRFIKLLTRTDQPQVFLAWSPQYFSESEVESIDRVAKTAKWHMFQRPLAVTALSEELSRLT